MTASNSIVQIDHSLQPIYVSKLSHFTITLFTQKINQDATTIKFCHAFGGTHYIIHFQIFSEVIEFDSPSPTNEFFAIPRQSRSKSVDHQVVPISLKDVKEKKKCVKCGHHFNGYSSKEA